MTALNIRANLKVLAHLTASGLVKAGDAVGNAKLPNKSNIQFNVDNLRRNVANRINPDQ